MQAELLDLSNVAVSEGMFDNPNIMADDEDPPIYRDLMALKPAGLSPNAWAVAAGVSRTVWADMRRHGKPRRETLEKLLFTIDVSIADFEARRQSVQTEVRGTGMSPREVQAAWSLPKHASKPVPLLGSAYGGDFEGLQDVEMTELRLSDVLDYLGRPPSLAGDDEAYAVEIVGESMAPRFEPGERAYVSPKSPVRIGDDVVVQLTNVRAEDGSDVATDITMVLIKRLVRRGPDYVELKQFNPDNTFRIPLRNVRRIHRVKGRL